MISSSLTRFYATCLMLAAILLPAAAQAQRQDEPHTAQSAQVESAVVKIFSTLRAPDPFGV